MAIKLEMLRVFQTVAEQGALSLAAAKLGRTPSAVSMMLSQLEDHIGDRLFETDRKNRLTPLGRLILEESRRANDAFIRSLDAIERHATSVAGTIRIAAVPSATVTLLPRVVARFRQDHPDVRLDISDVDSASVRRRIQFDEADIGIISAPVGDQPEGQVILSDHMGIICHKDGPIARHCADDTCPNWDVLQLEPFIANSLCALVDHPFVQDQLVKGTLAAQNTTALLAFVRAGIGATILPKTALISDPDIRFIVPHGQSFQRHLIKIQSPDRKLSPVAQRFMDQLGRDAAP